MVAIFGELTGEVACLRMRERMLSNSIGRRILHEKPIINSTTVPIAKLQGLPQSTFGYHYAQFMLRNKIDSDHRQPVQFIKDPELAYVMLRYRQVHDFWHTLTSMPIHLLGEISLKFIEYQQTGLPMALLASLVAPVLRFSSEEKNSFRKEYWPWIVKQLLMNQKNGHPVDWMNVYYEEHWEMDITTLRTQLHILAFPSPEKDLNKE